MRLSFKVVRTCRATLAAHSLEPATPLCHTGAGLQAPGGLGSVGRQLLIYQFRYWDRHRLILHRHLSAMQLLDPPPTTRNQQSLQVVARASVHD